MNPKRHTISTFLAEDHHRKFAAYCAERGLTMSYILGEFVKAAIADYQAPEGFDLPAIRRRIRETHKPII